MAESTQSPSVELVREAGDSLASEFGKCLSAVLGTTIEFKPEDVGCVDAAAAADSAAPLLVASCTAGEASSIAFQVALPRADAALLAGLQLGHDAAEIDSLAKEPLDGENQAAFQAVIRPLLATLATALPDAGLSDASVTDVSEVAEPSSDASWLAGSRMVRARFAFDCDHRSGAQLDLLLPAEGGASAAGGGQSLVFLETCPEEFDRLEALGAALSCDVSVELPASFFAELAAEPDTEFGAMTLILPWEFEGRSGLELAETLLRDERLSESRVVISSAAPTRAQVSAALRAGASSFLSRPYEKEEIERRLLGVVSGAPGPEVDSGKEEAE